MESIPNVIPIPWTIDKDYYMTQERWKVLLDTDTESILLDTDMIFPKPRLCMGIHETF